MSMKKTEMYLLASAYSMNRLLFTKSRLMKMPRTSRYLTQKRPSFTTIASLFLQIVMHNINRKRTRKLRDILKIVEGPMQSNWLNK